VYSTNEILRQNTVTSRSTTATKHQPIQM